MKYGDIIQEPNWNHWWPKWKRYPRLQYRFRVDPVPYIHNEVYKRGYRMQQSAGEKRQFYACEDPIMIRRKRHPDLLPDPWNDWHRSDIRDKRSWKKKPIKKQWMKHIG